MARDPGVPLGAQYAQFPLGVAWPGAIRRARPGNRHQRVRRRSRARR